MKHIHAKPSPRRILVMTITSLIVIVSYAVSCALVYSSLGTTQIPAALHPPVPQPTPSVKEPIFDKGKLSTTDPNSPWIVANKSHQLNPAHYSPPDLIMTHGATIRDIARVDLEAMLSAAASDGVTIPITSSYRSHAYQSTLYNNYVAAHGQATADSFSARPGHSEHQTGLSIDFASSSNSTCNLSACYKNTIEGEWLYKHAHEYGFILRYPENKQTITGYIFEPWHYRYVGSELAAEINKGYPITLEEFFDIPGGEIYS